MRQVIQEHGKKVPRKVRRAIARYDTKFAIAELDNNNRMDFQKTPKKRKRIANLIKDLS